MFSSFRRAACSSLNNLEVNLTKRVSQNCRYTTSQSSRSPLRPLLAQRSTQPLYPRLVRPAHTYQRFNNRQVGRIKVNRNVLIAGGVGFSGFYVYNLERVPVSNRLRFNVVSSESEIAMSKEACKQILEQNAGKILPPSSRAAQQVTKVMQRLIPASGLEDLDWEIYVINDPTQKNAFVIPGGKVFVFSGILNITQNDDALATVLSHEISHCLAHHSAERMSQMYIFAFGIYLLSFLFGAPADFTATTADLVLGKPASRKQESEADYIGLMMMSSACYDPTEAGRFWQRMDKAAGAMDSPPQFLSTHPSNVTRMRDIEKWLPEAQDKRQTGDCASTMEYAQDFQNAFEQLKW